LTRRLGVEWEPVAPGKLAAEIKGVPKAVLRDQSRRHQEIVQRMADRGESSPRAAQAAALDTRKAKDYDLDRRDIAHELRSRIAEKGPGPGRAGRGRRPPAAGATDQDRAGADFMRAAWP
jgi:conjugative relaxase-like TrwC/TraI family protein